MKRGLFSGGVVSLGLIVSLAVLGVGYGLWADTLRINGAVATGAVNAGFSVHEVDEGLKRGEVNGPSDNDVNEDKEAGDLDIAECRTRILAPVGDVSPEPTDDAASDVIARPAADFLYVFVRNGYPSFNCYVDFDVHNAGSIPIKVSKPAIGPVPDPRILTVEFEKCYDDGVQVEPGKEVLCTLHVHVERGAVQNSVYRFGATICAYQWNVGGPIRCAIPTQLEALPADIESELRPTPLP